MGKLKPTRKVTGATAAGAAAAIIAWFLGEVGLDVPPGLEGAFATLLAAAGGWLVRERA